MLFPRRLPLLFLLLVLAGRAADPLATLRSGHPRLLLDAAGFESLKAGEKLDPLREKLDRRIVRAAEAQLKEPPIAHVLVGPRLLDQSRRALAHVTTGAMAWRLTGDRRFADHARDVMLTAAAFPDWNPSHFLDVAEMATALGLGYDWLYSELTPAERALVRRALVDKALVYASPAYARADPNRRSFPFVGGNLVDNWNQVCNGGFLVAALAVAEDEPDLARVVIAGLRDTLPHAVAAYEPDGAYPEGPGYWSYGTTYNVLILAALQSALGRDFGLGALPGFDRTSLYRLQIEGPTGFTFNYADGTASVASSPALAWLGRHFGQLAVVRHERHLLAVQLARNGSGASDRFLALQAIWFPAESAALGAALPLDARFLGRGQLAIFRSAWDDPAALWVGFKAGSNAVNHAHLDLGSFVLEADGQRWAHDLGPDNYDLPGYWERGAGGRRWRIYRLNNFSHNTLTPGSALQSPDADAPITAFGSSPAKAFAVADLGAVYPGEARQFRRGIALLDRARVLVQDEISGLRADTPLTWRLMTRAIVAVDGRVATLTQHGRILRAEILAPADARFSAARPGGSPAEERNEGYTVLQAVVPAGAHPDVRLAIVLTPVGGRWPALKPVELVPLADWR